MNYEHWIIQKYPETAWLDSEDLNYWANEHGWLLISAVSSYENQMIYTFRREVKEKF